MPGTVTEAPTVSLSCMILFASTRVQIRRVYTNLLPLVANNFWGKDDAGVQPLLERMHCAKVTSDELKSFYNGQRLWSAKLSIVADRHDKLELL